MHRPDKHLIKIGADSTDPECNSAYLTHLPLDRMAEKVPTITQSAISSNHYFQEIPVPGYSVAEWIDATPSALFVSESNQYSIPVTSIN